MKKNDLIKIFEENNALLTGHFRLSSGLHSAQYLQCALVLQYPKTLEKLATDLIKYFSKIHIDTVVSLAIGGIVIGQEVARLLGAKAIFTERKADPAKPKQEIKMELRRGFNIKKGEKCLVIEDVITTGGSTKEVIDIIESFGGEIVDVGAIIDRSSNDISFGVQTKAIIKTIKPKVLLKLNIDTYQPEDCSLCKRKIKLITPGSKK